MDLDFSRCKTKEDVQKVFDSKKEEITALKKLKEKL
jgi:hypothetical protein